MQYLIKHTTHTTGETFTDVTKIRDNETYQVVEAESKEEAEKMVKESIQCPRCKSMDIDYEYYYEDSNEPSYIYVICHNCMGVCLEEIRKDSDQ